MFRSVALITLSLCRGADSDVTAWQQLTFLSLSEMSEEKLMQEQVKIETRPSHNSHISFFFFLEISIRLFGKRESIPASLETFTRFRMEMLDVNTLFHNYISVTSPSFQVVKAYIFQGKKNQIHGTSARTQHKLT